MEQDLDQVRLRQEGRSPNAVKQVIEPAETCSLIENGWEGLLRGLPQPATYAPVKPHVQDFLPPHLRTDLSTANTMAGASSLTGRDEPGVSARLAVRGVNADSAPVNTSTSGDAVTKALMQDLSCTEDGDGVASVDSRGKELMFDAALDTKQAGQYLAQLYASGDLNVLQVMRPGDNPRVLVKKERYRHRLVAYGLANGAKYVDIAYKTGYTKEHIGNLAAQPWMQRLVLVVQNTLGFDAVNMALRETVMGSIGTLIEIQQDREQPASVRARVSEYFLDRVLGKAVQPITNPSVSPNDPIDEIRQIDAELQNAVGSFPVDGEDAFVAADDKINSEFEE